MELGALIACTSAVHSNICFLLPKIHKLVLCFYKNLARDQLLVSKHYYISQIPV